MLASSAATANDQLSVWRARLSKFAMHGQVHVKHGMRKFVHYLNQIPFRYAADVVLGPNRQPHKKWSTIETPMISLVAAVLWFTFCSVIMLTSMNYVHDRAMAEDFARLEPLPDIIHDNVSKLLPEKTGDQLMVLLLIMLALVEFILNKGRLWVTIASRAIATMGTVYLLKGLVVVCTLLPLTDNHCRRGEDPASIQHPQWNVFLGLATFGSANIHCGDLMFSGHSAMLTMLWCSATYYFPHYRLYSWFSTIVSVLAGLVICAARQHYTVDVVMGWLIALLVWKTLPAYWPWQWKPVNQCCDNEACECPCRLRDVPDKAKSDAPAPSSPV